MQNGYDKYELQAANPAVEKLVQEKGSPALIKSSVTLLNSALAKLIESINNRNTKDPVVIQNAIEQTDALLRFCKENDNYDPALQGRLAADRTSLVNMLPTGTKVPTSEERLQYESYELILQTAKMKRQSLESEFTTDRSKMNREKLVAAIQSELYLMETYKINPKSGASPDFTHEREELTKKLNLIPFGLTPDTIAR